MLQNKKCLKTNGLRQIAEELREWFSVHFADLKERERERERGGGE